MERNLRIMFSGYSGSGKTTLAKMISERYNIPFVSGSYSDLVPLTKYQPHKDMIKDNPEDIFRNDMQLINLRNKVYAKYPSFVTDRSFIDSIAYGIQKLSHQVEGCDLDHLIYTAVTCQLKLCTHLIVLPMSIGKLSNPQYHIEDNHKRILNKWYQFEISRLIEGAVEFFYSFNMSKVVKLAKITTYPDPEETYKHIEYFLNS